MGSLKRKLSKRIQSNIQALMNMNWDYIALSSQTDFNQAFLPDDIPHIYDYALSLLQKGNNKVAMLLLRRICDYPYPYACKADALAQTGLSLLCSVFPENLANRRSILNEARHYLDKCTLLDQHNPRALGGWTLYHYLNEDYLLAAETFLAIPEGDLKNYILMHTFCYADGAHHYLQTINTDIDNLVAAFEKVYAWAKASQSKYIVKIGLVAGELSTYSGAFLKAYELYRDLLNFANREPLIFDRLGETCCHLDRIDEAELYYKQALLACKELISIADSSDELNVEAIREILRSSRINLASIACEQGKDIEESIAVLEKELADGSFSNPVYHNLAMCYFWKQDYKRSLDYCHKALALAQDETTLQLIAKNLHASKEFDQAIRWYKKALAFIDANQSTLCIPIQSAPNSFSFCRPEWLESKKKSILSDLIHCCLESGDLSSAQEWFSLAEAHWPRDASLFTLKALLHHSGQTSQNTVRTIGDARLYPSIKQEMLSLFPACHSHTIEFLTTGEFLYRIHSQTDMDYSPVLIEYCKALEHELTLYMEKIGHLYHAAKPTLGSLARLFRSTHSDDEHLANLIDTILTYRNMAAHNSVITRDIADTVRDGLLHKGLLTALTGPSSFDHPA